MTDHLKASIDQIFPPEPPDDPRPEPPPPPDDALREALADYAHEAWSGWMNYLLSKSIVNGDGTWTIPASLVTRWYRQMSTPYHLLPEDEQASDRDEAEKMLAIMADGRAAALLRAVVRIDRDIAAHPNRSLLFWRIPCDTVGHQPELSLSNGQSVRRPLPDALIELVAQLEARND